MGGADRVFVLDQPSDRILSNDNGCEDPRLPTSERIPKP